MMKRVTVYADGAAEPNPGPGGYGVVLMFEGHRRELHGGFRWTTNNRMEITGAIKGLEALKERCEVLLVSDSKYVVESMQAGRVAAWAALGGCKKAGGEQVPNWDLWQRLLALCGKRQVTFEWVKGHAGHPENERCDELSMLLIRENGLPADEGYEAGVMGALEAEEGEVEELQKKPESRKVVRAGQPCRKCGVAVERRVPKRKAGKPGAFYFEWFLMCPGCKAIYMVEEAKRFY